jgi:hypothetical protein
MQIMARMVTKEMQASLAIPTLPSNSILVNFLLETINIRKFSGGLNLPAPEPLPGMDVRIPYFFVGDGAFPLGKNLMKPFGGVNLDEQQRIFNYRLFYKF